MIKSLISAIDGPLPESFVSPGDCHFKKNSPLSTASQSCTEFGSVSTQLSLVIKADLLPMTGERFIPGMPTTIEVEHMHRYALAVPLARGKRVLDVASGEGYGSHLLAAVAKSVIGVDISPEAIAYAQQRYSACNLEYLQGDCAALPLADNSVDLVISFETIEHHDQHENMMEEIARVLTPCGQLLISSPNKKTYSDIPGKHNEFHVKELYLNEFKSLLDRYFSNVVIYGQRAEMSSVIVPLVAEDTTFRQFKGNKALVDSQGDTESAIYFVALAGRDSQPPTLGSSIYNTSSINGPIDDAQFQQALRLTKMYWYSHRDASPGAYTEQQQSGADTLLMDSTTKFS